jgi:hypothetical protein
LVPFPPRAKERTTHESYYSEIAAGIGAADLVFTWLDRDVLLANHEVVLYEIAFAKALLKPVVVGARPKQRWTSFTFHNVIHVEGTTATAALRSYLTQRGASAQ